jgi:diadenosine tetraphosphate (Ap4A) HIT family hydrolase
VTTLDELVADPWFPFEGDVRVKSLQPRQVPEPDRKHLTEADCAACAKDDSEYVWTDPNWRLRGDGEPGPIAGVVLLESRGHYDSYADLPPELLAEVGPLTARIECALLTLSDVARVHVARWGDGSAHFHQWFFPRPLGQLQLRGSMLPVWMDVLPALPDPDKAAALAWVGAAMAAGDRAPG